MATVDIVMDGSVFPRVDVFAAGLPCPPFSIAGMQLGCQDERDLFPQTLRLTEQISPRRSAAGECAGARGRRFDDYRAQILQRLHGLGYRRHPRVAL